MKTISVVVPCYNEEENVEAMADAIRETFRRDLTDYRYEIIFIDNDSSDRTREIIRRLCGEDKGIKGIFNAKNFGQFNSPYYGMLQSTGDCTILVAADFQDPVEMIPKFVLEWEYGYKIVIGIKSSSKENPLMYWLRGCYYKLIKRLSDVEQIEQFTGFGLYDADFIQVLRELDDPTPFLRGIVAELGFRRKEIPYEQPLRRAGKTSNNFYRLYDAAMLSITSYTKTGLRLATIVGAVFSGFSMVMAAVYLVMKLLYWDNFPAGMAPMLIGMCLLSSVQIFFIGMVGEYVLSINHRMMKRPLVVEEERINFSSGPSGNRKNRNGKRNGQELKGSQRPEPKGSQKQQSSQKKAEQGQQGGQKPEQKNGQRPEAKNSQKPESGQQGGQKQKSRQGGEGKEPVLPGTATEGERPQEMIEGEHRSKRRRRRKKSGSVQGGREVSLSEETQEQ